ncbi:MAG TPA: tRNA (adenosine(37)-N6)-threonylcarbamoyltransferase complex ATPase subunit type 1 TsaE [Geobacterales bacterium]|nr:tRNA (adenosine(37)-N6)-threonylcarbamoyltransferase complex ATPase subunit type 1 TsaE [Geobacterales bacterium]
MQQLISQSADETERLGERLGALLAAGDVVALVGELGGGKTCFTRGIARGLGVDPTQPLTSPTFTLMQQYQGRVPLYHFDLYRLAGTADDHDLGFEEYLEGDGAAVIEWAERLPGLLPTERLTVTFHWQDDEERSLCFEPRGERYEELVKTLFRN